MVVILTIHYARLIYSYTLNGDIYMLMYSNRFHDNNGYLYIQKIPLQDLTRLLEHLYINKNDTKYVNRL